MAPITRFGPAARGAKEAVPACRLLWTARNLYAKGGPPASSRPAALDVLARKLTPASEYTAGLSTAHYAVKTRRRSGRWRRHGSPSGLLRQMQDQTRNERRDADYDEKRASRDGGQVPD